MLLRKREAIVLMIASFISGCASLVIPDSVATDSADFSKEAESVSKTYNFADCSHLKNKTFEIKVSANIAKEEKFLTANDPSSLTGTDPKLTIKKFSLTGGIDQFVRDRLAWHLRERCGAHIGIGSGSNPLIVTVADVLTEVEGSNLKRDGDPSAIGFKVDQKLNLTVNNISHLHVKGIYKGRGFTYKNIAKNTFSRKFEFHKDGFQMVTIFDDAAETSVGGELLASTVQNGRIVQTFVLITWIPKIEASLGIVTFKNGKPEKAIFGEFGDIAEIEKALISSVGRFGSAKNGVEKQDLKDAIATVEMYTGTMGYVGVGNIAYMTHQFANELLMDLKD